MHSVRCFMLLYMVKQNGYPAQQLLFYRKVQSWSMCLVIPFNACLTKGDGKVIKKFLPVSSGGTVDTLLQTAAIAMFAMCCYKSQIFANIATCLLQKGFRSVPYMSGSSNSENGTTTFSLLREKGHFLLGERQYFLAARHWCLIYIVWYQNLAKRIFCSIT